MDKKSMTALQAKINQFFKGKQAPKEALLFILKALTLKFLANNDEIDFLKHQVALKEAFTFENIFTIWNQEPLEKSFFPEKNEEIDDDLWAWLMVFIGDFPLLRGENTDIIGVIYEKQVMIHHKKNQGVFYTPRLIADFMVKQVEVQNGADFKMLDPACGSGMLLSASYDYLFKHLTRETDQATKRTIHQQLLEKTLMGIDRDELACLVSKLILILKGHTFINPAGIHHGDVLCDDLIKNQSIDLVIANPPYVGHKEIDPTYMTALKKKYSGVYQDKGDLSYCFVYRSWELLKDQGQLIYISSRYFLEAHFAAGLRGFMARHLEIQELIDFNGNRVIEGVGVDLAILNLKKSKVIDQDHQMVVKRFKIPGDHDFKRAELVKDLSRGRAKSFERYFVDQKQVTQAPWRLYKPITRDIINKIEAKAPLFLSQVGETFQGMISGMDKAFIFDDLPFELTDHSCLKAWLKSKDVQANYLNPASKVLVYTDGITDIESEAELFAYLLSHQEKLKNRRECRLGKRPWYFLQWGRKLINFESKKIVFPYKAAKNRFAVDDQGACFSADIYGLVLKKPSDYCEESLAFLLNSRLYNYYFKSYAKKLGHNLYDYYPNTVLKLKIPVFSGKELNQIKDYYAILKVKQNRHNQQVKDKDDQFNHFLYDYFDLKTDQVNEIEKMG